jgi:hypothetical protein
VLRPERHVVEELPGDRSEGEPREASAEAKDEIATTDGDRHGVVSYL